MKLWLESVGVHVEPYFGAGLVKPEGGGCLGDADIHITSGTNELGT